ncbi:MAG: hypothetical protein K0S75_1044 [Clostridia bacterium]|nr:hypothetical protein [Clostridia bacterium]
MKKLFLVFALCALSLYGVLFCYADVNSKTMNIMEDLPWVTRSETIDNLKYINEYNADLQSVISEQSTNINALNAIYYIGNYKERFDGSSLKKCLDWQSNYLESAPLFISDKYKGYYSLRTGKILKQYQTTEFFDYAAFVKSGRQEFDSYIKGAVKDQNSMGQLTLLLQEKLLDKLIELEPMKRKVFLEEVLDLGLPANRNKCLDSLYQMFESRVRLQLFDQMADLNKEKLQSLNHKVGIVISAEKSGELLLQNKTINSKDKAVQIINVMQGEEGYKGLTLLNELYSKQNYNLVFNREDGDSQEIELEKAIDVIAIDENGYVHLDLDILLKQESKTNENTASTSSAVINNGESQLKQLEVLYHSKSSSASEVIREMNRYSIYMELKDARVSNLYTKGFEARQKTWKKNLDNKLNTFGIGGSADLIAYVKQFELLDRNPNKGDKARVLVAKYRNSDIQFRTTQEGSIWLTNMISKLRLMK